MEGRLARYAVDPRLDPRGAAYAFGDPGIRAVILLSAAINLATADLSRSAWLANVRFEGEPALFGLMFAGFGAGAVIGAVIAGSTARPRRFGMVVLGLAIVLPSRWLPSASHRTHCSRRPGWWVPGSQPATSTSRSSRGCKARSEPALLGQVMGLVMLGAFGLQPVSFAIAGGLVDACPPRPCTSSQEVDPRSRRGRVLQWRQRRPRRKESMS